MLMKAHFELMAGYNSRMNRQVYDAAARLDERDLERDAGAFFGSVIGTLNHIVVGDILWLTRFGSHSDGYHALDHVLQFPKPAALNQILYSNLTDLDVARKKLDLIIENWLKTETVEDDFERELLYTNTRGITSRRKFGELVSHFFNHQTHHRGQVSTLLNQFGQDVGITDFLIDIPDTHI